MASIRAALREGTRTILRSRHLQDGERCAVHRTLANGATFVQRVILAAAAQK